MVSFLFLYLARMNNYYKVRFDLNPCTETETDVLAALLCDAGFESFEPDCKGVSAYIRQELYEPSVVNDAIAAYPFSSSIKVTEELIEGQDWNSEWEKHYFKPIVFEDRCVVHSSFHTDYPKAEYDIVIDPKMAFGTGHHETTSLMIRRILSADMAGKNVLDMGTGTGILAILSAMRGAGNVVGVEIDPPAYENAKENVAVNGEERIDIRLGGVDAVKEVEYFDYVLANINRNIILADIGSYAKALKSGGTMLLSGFYIHDVDMIVEAAGKYGLQKLSVLSQKDWANLMLIKL